MRITAFYGRVFNTIVPASSLEVAELAKLLENSYRFINISFINEMAMFCDKLGIDLWEAIATANYKALWVPGVLSWPWDWRALHPDRPFIFILGWRTAWLPHPIFIVIGANEPDDNLLCHRTD